MVSSPGIKKWRIREVGMLLAGPGVLVVAAVVFAAIWAVVLLGSRYFGPQ
jgi:hypothetical protein